jgi:putative tryptophan/tyrosine transport system substrate-binding protein
MRRDDFGGRAGGLTAVFCEKAVGILRRRKFIQAAIGSVLAVPIAARAQTMPVIGYLSPLSQERAVAHVAALRRGLAETGFVEGRDLVIEYRWGDGDFDRLPGMADELVRRPVRLILAAASPAALAAKAATASIERNRFAVGSG